MNTISDTWFYLSAIHFVIAVFLAFTIPGFIILSKIRVSITSWQKVVLGTVVGLVLWGWLGFLFGILHLRFLSYIYVVGALALFLQLYGRKVTRYIKSVRVVRFDLFIGVIIILGMVPQLLQVWGFNLSFDQGLYLCCANKEDLLLHLSITKGVIKQVPPVEPGRNDILIQSYHYFSNIVVGELIRVFKLVPEYTQFQHSSFFMSLFLGLIGVVFGQISSVSRVFVRWFVFLLYFGSDSIYIYCCCFLVRVFKR